MAEGNPNEVHHHHYHTPGKDPTIAVLLELLPGLFLQTFGIGHIYAGKAVTGIIIMLAYWFLAFINFWLIFLLIGIITWPLTFLVFIIVSPIAANNAAKQFNQSTPSA